MKAWAVIITLLALLAGPATAAEFGQFCWQLQPFKDVLLVSISASDGPPGLVSLYEMSGKIYAKANGGEEAIGGAGPMEYHLLGTGTGSISPTQPNTLDLGFQAVHQGGGFAGNIGCHLSATLTNLFALSGPWTLQCPGETPFEEEGTMVYMTNCPVE